MQVCRWLAGAAALTACDPTAIAPDLRVGTPCPAVVMRELNNAFIATHPAPVRGMSWQHADYFMGDLAAAETVGEPIYVDYAFRFGDINKWELIGETDTRNPDNQAAGQVYFELYEIVPDPVRTAELAKSLDWVIRDVRRDSWQNTRALFHAAPAWAQIGSLTSDQRYFETAFQLFVFARDVIQLFDPDAGLWYTDLEHRFPQHKTPNDKKIFWSRGNGWVFASFARELPFVPADSRFRPDYEATFRTMAAAIAPLQRDDGFWNVSLFDPEDHPGPESSGTSLFTFGFAWGINNGLLDRDTYLPVVERAWLGLNTIAVRADRQLGYVQGLGGGLADGPDDAQPVSILSTEDYGLGYFLLAGNEVAKLGLDLGCTP
ncbi:MAG TPA: glycoside hydrolase family 88 protein [Kofleriaceae bacterium]|nr:glycoside hydrolase family 88 protein [Kofleriaceae bacterium]